MRIEKLVVLFAYTLFASAAFAQGAINFNNMKSTRQIINDANGNKLEDGYAQLYAGKSADSLSAVGSPVIFYDGVKFGCFSGGVVDIGFNGAGFCQVKAWQGADTFYEALTRGESNVFGLTLGDSTASPPPLASELEGFESFSLHVIKGTTKIIVDGREVVDSVVKGGKAEVILSNPHVGGLTFNTLDGSEPTFESTLYQAPFTITKTSVIRVLSYNDDFSLFDEANPVTVNIMHDYVLDTGVSGQGIVENNRLSWESQGASWKCNHERHDRTPTTGVLNREWTRRNAKLRTENF